MKNKKYLIFSLLLTSFLLASPQVFADSKAGCKCNPTIVNPTKDYTLCKQCGYLCYVKNGCICPCTKKNKK